MKLLLDTHTFLWHSDGNPRMSTTATTLLVDPTNELFLSMASVWEIAIKVGLKKLNLSQPYAQFMSTAITGYGLHCRELRASRHDHNRKSMNIRARSNL